MTYIDKIFDNNFLEYASYVIKDRAIPHIDDGLKPVQRRILHSLYELDDGKFHKVANIVGHSMKYHPHGDASIYSALVVLANKDLFIEKQGNFGNIFTGDEASAARYIEARLMPLAFETLFNPEITEYVDSYDGRNREPVTLPAKIPVTLALGAEGIAVGMATKILPHNFIELLEAQISCLYKEPFEIFPDFPTAGIVDVSEYCDGNGKVTVRAKLDTSDPKRILITEVPFGCTTESLIASIENAAKKNKVKISTINDYTAEKVEIEIKLARGVTTKDVIDSLYAFTDCESSISVNLMIINRENKPQIMTATEVIKYATERLLEILTAELQLEERQLKDQLHAKTLEQIFIENRIYKGIEDKTTHDTVTKAVLDGLLPYADEIRREVTTEDVERLLKIPIRRISLYDINKAKKEMQEIKKRIKEIHDHLDNIVEYAVSYLEKLIEKYRHFYPRRTHIVSFKKIDVREAAKKDLKLSYDGTTGYLGYGVEGRDLFNVSQYDRVLVIRKSGEYSVIDAPEKLFIDKGMLYCGFVNKDVIFNIIYKEKKTGFACIKRCVIDRFILAKTYDLTPEGCVTLRLTTDSRKMIQLLYKPKPRVKILEETFIINGELHPVRGVKAKGVRLSRREIKSARFISPGGVPENGDYSDDTTGETGDTNGETGGIPPNEILIQETPGQENKNSCAAHETHTETIPATNFFEAPADDDISALVEDSETESELHLFTSEDESGEDAGEGIERGANKSKTSNTANTETQKTKDPATKKDKTKTSPKPSKNQLTIDI